MGSGGWLSFCNDNRIPHRPGSGRKNIEIRCPYCGISDQSKNMGLSLDSTKWGCWREKDHRGISPAKLIRELLKCSHSEAMGLARTYFEWNGTFIGRKEDISFVSISKPPEFHPFTFNDRNESHFINYIENRGLDPEVIARRFDLHYAMQGNFSWRLVTPIKFEHRWYTYVARAISKQDPIRYKACPKEITTTRPADFLFDYDNLSGGKLLVVVEGLFDVFKISSTFIPGVHATCLFGKVITSHQILLLQKLALKYDKIAISLDPDAYAGGVQMLINLQWFISNLIFIPVNTCDWGDKEIPTIKKELIAHV